MSYGQSMAQLAYGLNGLLAEGSPGPGRPLPVESARQTLAARDLVVAEVRTLTRGLTGGGAPAHGVALELRHVATDPAHVMHQALVDLGRVGAGEVSPLQVVTSDARGARVEGWRAAARAALALEPYNDQVAALPGPAAWDALREVSALASALPVLDRDLAQALPLSMTAARDQLTRPEPYALLTVAAAAVAAQTADVPGWRQMLALEPAMPLSAVLVREGTQLPEATRELTRTLAQRGGRAALLDLVAAARVASYGITAVQAVAGRVEVTPEQRQALQALSPAAEPLIQAYLKRSTGDTLDNPPSVRVRALGTEILAGIQQMQHTSTDLQGALLWARELPDLASTAVACLHAATEEGRFLRRPDEFDTDRQSELLLTRVHDVSSQPVAKHLQAASALLARAQPALDTATRVEEPARVSAARFAAARTAHAVEEMRGALGKRTAQAPIAPPRPPHPAYRQPPRGPAR